jgi:hypothetical protein
MCLLQTTITRAQPDMQWQVPYALASNVTNSDDAATPQCDNLHACEPQATALTRLPGYTAST